MEPKFFVECATGLLPARTGVLGFEGTEEISGLFRFDIDLIVPAGPLDLDRAIATPISLGISRGAYREPILIHGVLSEAELTGQAGPPYQGWLVYRVALVPKVWLLALHQRGFVYVDSSQDNVVSSVMSSGKMDTDDWKLELAGSYPQIDFTCQYLETHLDFLSRSLEQWGVYYYFDQDTANGQMVITDNKTKQTSQNYEPVPYVSKGQHSISQTQECFGEFRCRRVGVPKKVQVRGYDYSHPGVPISESADVPGGTGALSLYGESVTNSRGARRQAETLAGHFDTRRLAYIAKGTVPWIRAGYQFKVQDYFENSVNKTVFLATAVRHFGDQWSLWFGVADGQKAKSIEYHCEIDAIDSQTRFWPPRKTPVPRIDGVVTAVVGGVTDGTYAELDSAGRYHVKFKFDDSDASGLSASAPVRMLQPHGGQNEFFNFPLRKGTEVQVAFLGGNPDNPIIVGVAPNASDMNLINSKNNTQNIIHTGGDNRIEVEDLLGSQRMTISSPTQTSVLSLGSPITVEKASALSDSMFAKADAPHQVVLMTKGKGLVGTGDDLDTVVGGNRTETVGGTDAELVKGNATKEHRGTYTNTVTGAVAETFNSTHSLNVSADETANYFGKQTITVSGDVSETYKATQTTTVTAKVLQTYKADQETKITGSQRTYVKGTECRLDIANGQFLIVGGLSSQTFNGGLVQEVMGATSHSATGKITVSANSDINVTSLTAINLTAPNLKETAPSWFKVAGAVGTLTFESMLIAINQCNLLATQITLVGMRIEVVVLMMQTMVFKLHKGIFDMQTCVFTVNKTGFHVHT